MKLTSIVAAFAVAVITLQARAADDVDMAQVFRELRPATASVRVVISDAQTYYVATLTEQQMNKYGCTYAVTDSQDVHVLFDLLERGQIESAPPFYKFGPEPRIGIYLQGHDGSKHKLLFTGFRLKPKPEYGTYDGTVSVLAKNPDFATELRTWALTREPQRGTHCAPEKFHQRSAP